MNDDNLGSGFFGNGFDFNGDGGLDTAERASDLGQFMDSYGNDIIGKNDSDEGFSMEEWDDIPVEEGTFPGIDTFHVENAGMCNEDEEQRVDTQDPNEVGTQWKQPLVKRSKTAILLGVIIALLFMLIWTVDWSAVVDLVLG